MNSPLVSTEWLAEHLYDDNVVILDAHMNTVVGKEPLVHEVFSCLPNAIKLDIEQDFCDLTSSQSHALPTESQFTSLTQSLGINQDSHVVIYDDQGIYSSPRAWWTFKSMGFNNVSVLDGGLPQWVKEHRPTSKHYVEVMSLGNAKGVYQPHLVTDAHEILSAIEDKSVTDNKSAILDARAELRFLGQAPEPREGVRSGHIPSAKNLPFAWLLDGFTYKDKDALEALFSERIHDVDTRSYFSCGSGITACILMLAAVSIGYKNVMLYDGSWAEWGTNTQLPIE